MLQRLKTHKAREWEAKTCHRLLPLYQVTTIFVSPFFSFYDIYRNSRINRLNCDEATMIPIIRPNCSPILFSTLIQTTFYFCKKNVFRWHFCKVDTSIKGTHFCGPNGVPFKEIPLYRVPEL